MGLQSTLERTRFPALMLAGERSEAVTSVVKISTHVHD